MFGLYLVFAYLAVHGYLTAVRYPNQIAANSLTAAKADLISQITIKLMPPPSAIALITLVAVCLVPCRTKAGSRLVRSRAVLLWLTVGYACHSSMLQHVAVTAIEIRKNTLLSISKGPGKSLLQSGLCRFLHAVQSLSCLAARVSLGQSVLR